MMAQFHSREIDQLSFDFRTLGLGYANLGGLLMSSGLPYDSDAGRQIPGALTASMTGVSYATSAEMAAGLRPPARRKEKRAPTLPAHPHHPPAAHQQPPRCNTSSSHPGP